LVDIAGSVAKSAATTTARVGVVAPLLETAIEPYR